ncbi:hypothetical protein LMH87_002827 [Akanthomyces muscarius]|uniref:Uncharacterized protein n=1 Tax=Akanthomyces muscarius TaxID=2231603 RepID=A0A9W8Q736_AKAMU|nr:hypothetical protein LMH87_002827 [Akanthomyces muscarius]KAJ4148352.1 hypothetical protein LMH87_002827 [Akanthomyces muscarius]
MATIKRLRGTFRYAWLFYPRDKKAGTKSRDAEETTTFDCQNNVSTPKSASSPPPKPLLDPWRSCLDDV